MTSKNESHSKNVPRENPWYRCGVATAYVSAIFSLVVLAFLILNYGKSKVVDTEDDIRLLSLKSELQGKPEDEALLSQIRTLDLQIRQRRLRAVDRARKGSQLLLGGVIVLLINIAIAGAMKKEPPTPRLGVEGPEQQVHEAKFARWAVTAGLVLLGSGALLLAFLPTVDYAGAGAAEALAANDPNKNWPRPALTTFGQNNHGLRFERWRYIQYADGSEELYDHENDPHEWHNVAGDPNNGGVIERLRRWLPKVNLPECPGTSGSGWQASEYAQGRRTLDDLFVE